MGPHPGWAMESRSCMSACSASHLHEVFLRFFGPGAFVTRITSNRMGFVDRKEAVRLAAVTMEVRTGRPLLHPIVASKELRVAS